MLVHRMFASQLKTGTHLYSGWREAMRVSPGKSIFWWDLNPRPTVHAKWNYLLLHLLVKNVHTLSTRAGHRNLRLLNVLTWPFIEKLLRSTFWWYHTFSNHFWGHNAFSEFFSKSSILKELNLQMYVLFAWTLSTADLNDHSHYLRQAILVMICIM
jgi:hypothetical protein